MRTGGCLGTHPSKRHSAGSPISERDAHPDEDRGVLRNPPFKKAFCWKSDLEQAHPPDEDKEVLRNPPFKRAF
jgi:hypothetical protein